MEGTHPRAVRRAPPAPTRRIGVVAGACGGGERCRGVRRAGRRLPGPQGGAQRRRHLGDQQPGRLLRSHQQADRRARRHDLLASRLQPRRRPGRLVGRRHQPVRRGGDPARSRPDAPAGRRGGLDPGDARGRHGRRQPRRARQRDRQAVGDPRGPGHRRPARRHPGRPERAAGPGRRRCCPGRLARRHRLRGLGRCRPAAHPYPVRHRLVRDADDLRSARPGRQRRRGPHRRRRDTGRARLRDRSADGHRRLGGRGAQGLGAPAAGTFVVRGAGRRSRGTALRRPGHGRGDRSRRRGRRRPGQPGPAG